MPYQIYQEHCSCCHQCKVHCPAGAIRFKGVKYWIDPEMCTDCGKCVEVCNNCVITRIDEKIKVEEHAPIKKECDLLVIGAGGSGLISAVRTALKTGKKVTVIEKSKKPGGSTWYASIFITHYSKLHKEAGFPDDREEKLRKLMNDTLWQLDPQLVNNVMHATEGFVNWLIDECGCKEDFAVGETVFFGKSLVFLNKTGKKFLRPDCTIGPGGMGSFVVLKMLELCEKLGIEVLTEHAAEKLILDKNGAVSGVIARDPGGIVEFSCKACVMATGCFSRNERLLRKANPDLFLPGEPVHFFGAPSCSGDGIEMAEAIGADIDYKNMRAMSLGPAHHPFGYCGVCMTREPETVIFNKEGKRWADETHNIMALRHLFLKQPGLICYSVMDSKTAKLQIDHLIGRGYDGENGVAIFRNYLSEIEEESKLDPAPTFIANTLEELAEKTGMPVKTFLAEVKRYNEFCRKGHDDDFFKDPKFLLPIEEPPFFAFYNKRFQENAMGGMKTDANTRVLKNGKPVPGLYAVGDNARGVQMGVATESDRVESSITALTWCMSSGYIAGESVSEFLTKK